MLSWILVWPNRPETRERFRPFVFAMKSTDWLAVDAVLGEHGSAGKSQKTGKITGNSGCFALSQPCCDGAGAEIGGF
jgi:hypothetical protein